MSTARNATKRLKKSGRIVVMAQGRNLQIDDSHEYYDTTIILFANDTKRIINDWIHPLGLLPWALATPDGFLRKTNKAALATLFQRMWNKLNRFQITLLPLSMAWTWYRKWMLTTCLLEMLPTQLWIWRWENRLNIWSLPRNVDQEQREIFTRRRKWASPPEYC